MLESNHFRVRKTERLLLLRSNDKDVHIHVYIKDLMNTNYRF